MAHSFNFKMCNRLKRSLYATQLLDEKYGRHRPGFELGININHLAPRRAKNVTKESILEYILIRKTK